MRAHIANRLRSSSLNAVPPPQSSSDYSTSLARDATRILYRSPIPSKDNRPVYILNSAALPDSQEADFDALLPYVLARLPEEDELIKGEEYEVIVFAGESDGSTTIKKHRPGWGWFLQAYHVLSRAMRKRIQKLYIVQEKAWIRILSEIFSTIVSPKFRRKIAHASSMSALALHIQIENLLIPPSAYLNDRRVSNEIYAPYASGRRAFAVRQPFPKSANGGTRLPRVLRETTAFLLMDRNIVTEGLFRVPPHSKLKDVLKEAYDRGQKFIVWKDNGVTLPLPNYPRAQGAEDIVRELDQRDCYGATMAAGLIKSWYAGLRQPIVPQTSYTDLKRLFGDPDDLPTPDRLAELIAPASEWSILPPISREIMTRHLFPLLDKVASRQEQNKMTPENLAVCIAPTLLCGPDQIEDAKMSSIIRRVLTVAIESWSEGLREACGVDPGALERELHLPENPEDWEDPLEARTYKQDQGELDEKQSTGIVLQDNDVPEMAERQPPPLPPRAIKSGSRVVTGGDSGGEIGTKRKPAPPLTVPPRYSMIVGDHTQGVAESPVSYAAVTDGFAPPRPTQESSPVEKKSGTNSAGVPTPQIILPKRKALTAEQIDNAESAVAQARTLSGSATALPGLANLNIAEAVKRKPLNQTKAEQEGGPTEKFTSGIALHTSPEDMAPPTLPSPNLGQPLSADIYFRRPSWPVSGNREPTITSLARPVYPTTRNAPGRPPSKSTSLPVPAPKPRTPSPSLLQRMPSFEQSGSAKPSTNLAPPRKLNLKKASVDDLRRLYEERAGTAKSLVEAGRQK